MGDKRKMTKEELHSKRTVALGELKYIEEALCLDEHYIDIIEQENTELNKRLAETNLNGNIVLRKLTKAIEIISAFVEWANWQGDKCPSFKSIQDKAEQYLKEIEE